jgi:hypothetical protein
LIVTNFNQGTSTDLPQKNITDSIKKSLKSTVSDERIAAYCPVLQVNELKNRLTL